MENYIKICPVENIKDFKGQKFYLDDLDIEVAVFRINDKFYVVDNVCPHQHRSILCDGFIENKSVICPAHGWEFNLETGKRQDGGKGINSYEIKIENGYIYAKIIKKSFNW
ncbi:MAG TPA: Rieske (2Fe-2S) protein [Ignavibacteriales bacterium]|jgi:NAD(P)H-dependent nitrite reductase small subunit|nr:Rieske (2Fe-2S) protein [Ignavibacteriales bacterium]